MYNVLVLEDEPPIRRYICRLVEKCSPHFRVIASGENGLEGLELFETYRPRLVITDVRMPGMNGLEFIQEIKNRGWQAHFLIISDYRDFEYARDSLKLGVYNYLTKPVIESQMRENLDKLYQMIGEERCFRQKRLLDSLLLGEQKQETAGLFDYACYRMVLWQKGCIRNQYMQFLFDGEKDHLLQERDIVKLEQRIRLRTNAEVIWTRGSEENTVIFLLCFGEKGESAKELSEGLFETGSKGYYTTVVSEPFSMTAQIAEQYKRCLRTVLQEAVLGQSRLLTNSGVLQKEAGSGDGLGERLLEMVRTGDTKQINTQLVQAFDLWEQQRCPLSRVEAELLEIFRVLSQKQQEAGVEAVPVQEYRQNLWELIFYAQSMADLLGGTMDMLLKGAERLTVRESTGTRSRQEQVLINIERYISEQLQTVNSLQDISEQFQLSPTYICRLFRNYRNLSFNEYLTGRKMEAAQSMLTQGRSVREAAAALGYQDAYYFSKVFKKKVGVTPTEYKQKLS